MSESVNFGDPRISEWLWSRVTPCPVSGCWIWFGWGGDYGRIAIVSGPSRKAVRAHRYFFEMLVAPIEAGLVIDHLCRVRRCVNPAHLEPVTNRTNVLRGVGPTAICAAGDRCAKGHPYTPENTRYRKGSRVCRRCAADHQNARRRAHAAAGLCILCDAPRAIGRYCARHGETEPARFRRLSARRWQTIKQRKAAIRSLAASPAETRGADRASTPGAKGGEP